jgi:hypothetical protein
MKHATTIAALAMLLLTGCRGIVEPREANPFADPAATPAAPPTRTATDLCDSDDGPPGVLAAISTSSLADRDRVVFQFHGQAVPDVTATYVDRITEDPTDRPVPLVGSTFLSVVFHGGRLDTAAIEPDPSAVVRYDGPTRLAPSYPILLELAVSGDFEAVLSFGLGLSHRTTVRTTTPPGRACVILDVMRSANAATW